MTKQYMIYDTETTGLFPDSIAIGHIFHNNYDYSVSPLMVTFAAHVTAVDFSSKNNRLIKVRNAMEMQSDLIINWPDIEISEEITKINGMTTEKMRTGVPPKRCFRNDQVNIERLSRNCCTQSNV